MSILGRMASRGMKLDGNSTWITRGGFLAPRLPKYLCDASGVYYEGGPLGGLRYTGVFEDFLADAGATLPKPWGTQDTSSAGSPTLDYVADQAGGKYVMKLATTTEAEAITLYWADQLMIDVTKNPLFLAYLKIESDVTGTGGVFAAGDKLVCGLASARNATLDNIATNAWFSFCGANHNILVETDDGTHDTDDQDTGVDWSEDTETFLAIDAADLSDVRFYVDGVDVTPSTGMNMHHATGNLQVFVELTKASAANKDHRVTIDCIGAFAER